MSLLLLSIYKSSKKDEMYLYVPKTDGLKNIPDALLSVFGTPVHVMDMPHKAGRNLARITDEKLRSEISEKGVYLKMPPQKEDYLLDLYNPDDRKSRDINR